MVDMLEKAQMRGSGVIRCAGGEPHQEGGWSGLLATLVPC